MSCFNCPCNDGDETVEEPVATTTTGPMPEPETTTQSGQPTSEPSGAKAATGTKHPAEVAPLAVLDILFKNPEIRDYPMALNQLSCVAWCSLVPGCKATAHIPDDRPCRFSSYSLHDDDFVPAADQSQGDIPEEGIYYWHDLTCMSCPCKDAPTTELPTTLITSTIAPTATQETSPPRPSVETCEWSNPFDACTIPQSMPMEGCLGSPANVDPSQYRRMPADHEPKITKPMQCAILYHTNSDCNAWGFAMNNQIPDCVFALNRKKVDELDSLNGAPYHTWYPGSCFECKSCVSQWN
ncbi:hypothetical protein FPOAC2_13217 [Fusarium poae]